MRTRLMLVAVCILALPMSYSVSIDDKRPAPFAVAALAGHNTAGGWCECGGPGCTCDPGEHGGGNAPATGEQKLVAQGAASPDSPGDLGVAVLMFTLAFLLWTRLRA